MTQPTQPQFVPFVVDEKATQELQAWLVEQPYKFSAPVLQWLAERMRIAAEQASAEQTPPVRLHKEEAK
jgi:hypothetical protein